MGDFMIKFLLAAIFTLPMLTEAQTAGRVVEGNIFPGIGISKNHVRNPQALKNAEEWITATTISITRNTTPPTLFDGANFLMTAGGAGTVYWSLLPLDAGMNQLNCEFSGIYKGGGASWTADIRVGSDVVNTLALGAVTEGRRFSLNYPCGGVTSVGFRTTASAPQLDVDDIYFGLARNIGSVAQATFVGGITTNGGASCEFSQNTSSGITNFVSLRTATTCAAWGVTSNGPGTLSAVATNDHRLTYTNMPPGNYQIIASGRFRSTTGGSCNFRLTDGVNQYDAQSMGSAGETINSRMIFNVSVLSAQTVTYTIQAADNHAGSCSWNAVDQAASWKIYRFPSASEQVFRPDQVAWRVDANISGANPSLGLATVSSYTGLTNSSLSLTNNVGAGIISAQIPCSGTNAPTGTTCSSGDESIGVSWLQPTAGDVLACATFNAFHASGTSSGVVTSTFKIVETPNNAQTIIQEGDSETMSRTIGVSASSNNLYFPHRNCSTFSFTSAGQKTLRLMFEQFVVGTVLNSEIKADADATLGQPTIHWEVYPLNYYQPAPLLIGSVVSNSSGIERLVRASVTTICSISPCTIRSRTPDVTSITRSSQGEYVMNIASGTFSETPTCSCSAIDASGNPRVCGIRQATSSPTAIAIHTQNNSFVFTDLSFDVICQGPR